MRVVLVYQYYLAAADDEPDPDDELDPDDDELEPAVLAGADGVDGAAGFEDDDDSPDPLALLVLPEPPDLSAARESVR